MEAIPARRRWRSSTCRRSAARSFCPRSRRPRPLVGSTALASRLDAEDWRSLVNAYLDEASGAVNRLGGHVLKRLGDGLMVLFGYPQAQENDAERVLLLREPDDGLAAGARVGAKQPVP